MKRAAQPRSERESRADAAVRIDRVGDGEHDPAWALLQEYLEILAQYVFLPRHPDGGYAYRSFHEYMDRTGNRRAYFARVGDEVAGLLLLHLASPSASPIGRESISMAELYVRPGRQRQGIGRAMVSWAADGAKELGLPLHWWVLQRNLPARRFYERVVPAVAQRIGYRIQRRCARSGDILWVLLPPKIKKHRA